MHSGVWILIGETFPTRTRAKQAALAAASNWYVASELWRQNELRLSCFRIGCGISCLHSLPHSSSQLSISSMDLFSQVTIFKSSIRKARIDSDLSCTPACNLAGAVFVYFFLYESSDLTLENVDRVRGIVTIF